MRAAIASGAEPAVDLWWVVFSDFDDYEEAFIDRHRWWRYWSDPGYRHCYLIGYRASNDGYVIVDALMNGLQAYPVTGEEVDAVFTAMTLTGGTVLKITPRAPECVLKRPPILYCVTAVKHVLGIKGLILSPKALCKRLIEDGAEYVIREGTIGDGQPLQIPKSSEGRSVG